MKGQSVPTELAEVTRGGIRESLHHGIVAVADSDGSIVASAGDPDHVAFFRSSAKPFQAIPLIESGAADRFGFSPAELALCCASHAGSREHQRQVAAMLVKLGLDEHALQCGVVMPGDSEEAGRVSSGLVAPSPLQCDCSGKHSGMLAACLQLGLPTDSYLDPDHPLQRQILEIMATVMHVPAASIVLGTDGCSLPTFAGSIAAFATGYAILANAVTGSTNDEIPHREALARLGAAMVAHPENVSGHGQLVTDLMIVGEGRIVAKSGAEGLLCFGLPDAGLGVAIRLLDGSYRSHAVIAARVLQELDAVPASAITELLRRHDLRIFNHNRRHVGDHRAVFSLTHAA
jgi:L-asparaginase II